jgi:ArsR family transcriptional regulator
MNYLLPILKAIADETRLRLLQLLLTQDLCGRALALRLGVTEAAVSQHLKILREAGLICGEKRGYWTHYVVQKEILIRMIGELQSMVRHATPRGGPCRRVRASHKRLSGKEVKSMCCGLCCEQPIKLKSKSEEYTPEQIMECHGDVKNHSCQGKKKEDGRTKKGKP